MTSILAGLFMAGFFITLEKWKFFEWYYEQFRPRFIYLPAICEHCLTFWFSLIYHLFLGLEIRYLGLLNLFFLALASTAVNYLVRK